MADNIDSVTCWYHYYHSGSDILFQGKYRIQTSASTTSKLALRADEVSKGAFRFQIQPKDFQS